MTLKIPNEVHNLHYNSTTFRPYDPNKAVGNTSPTRPKPVAPEGRPKEKCCGLGEIFVAVVSFAVTWAVTALLGPWAAPIAAGLGDAAGQEVAIAMGMQDHFSWNEVGFAMTAAAVTMGLSNIPGVKQVMASFSDGIAGDMARGAVGNMVTQGVAVGTGMQQKFDWTGVAVAGVTAGLSGAVSRSLARSAVNSAVERTIANGGSVMDTINAANKAAAGPMGVHGAENAMLSGMAGLMAGAAIRSVLDGTDFGDNILAALPGVIGQTLGNAAVDALKDSYDRARMEENQGWEDLNANAQVDRGDVRPVDVVSVEDNVVVPWRPDTADLVTSIPNYQIDPITSADFGMNTAYPQAVAAGASDWQNEPTTVEEVVVTANRLSDAQPAQPEAHHFHFTPSGVAHALLTTASFVPGPVGAAASLLDAGVYALQGDKVNAGISAGAAAVGLFADAGALKLAAVGGTKLAAHLLPAATGLGKVAKEAKVVGGVAKEAEEVGEVSTVFRKTRSGEIAVRQTRVDGSVIDISPQRVKEYVPNTHPDAPLGALNKVKFPDALPGSKGYKRAPTGEELEFLRDPK
jgi:hypothetical protein